MEFFACFHEFYNMSKKNREVKKSHQTKNLKFASALHFNLQIGISFKWILQNFWFWAYFRFTLVYLLKNHRIDQFSYTIAQNDQYDLKILFGVKFQT